MLGISNQQKIMSTKSNCGLCLEPLGRMGIMFKDMWFRHSDTFKINKNQATMRWKSMLRTSNLLSNMPRKSNSGLLLESLGTIWIVLNIMWFWYHDSFKIKNRTYLWWKSMLRISDILNIMFYQTLPR